MFLPISDAPNPKSIPFTTWTLIALNVAAFLLKYLELPAAARGALSPNEAVALASWLRREGNSDAALVLLRRVLQDNPRGRGPAEVHALAGFILLDDMRDATAAYQHLVTALELGPEPDTAAEIRRGLAAIEAQQKRHVGRIRSPRW